MSVTSNRRNTRLAVTPAYVPGAAPPAAYQLLAYETFQPNATRELLNMQRDSGGLGMQTTITRNVRLNRRLVTGDFTMKPTIDEWAFLLPWLMSGAPAAAAGATTYPLNEVGKRARIAYDDLSRVWTLAECQVAGFTVSAPAGGEVLLSVRLEGGDFATNPARPFSGETPGPAFPAAPVPWTLSPKFLTGDISVAVAGVTDAIRPRTVTLDVDFGSFNDRFYGTFGSLGATNVTRRPTLTLDLPAKLNEQVWAAGAQADGVGVSVAFAVPTVDGTTGLPTGGSRSLTFLMPAVKTPTGATDNTDPEITFAWTGTLCGDPALAADAASGYGKDTELTAVLDTAG